ncbi:DUF6894 family protein [Methylobacterium gnaphalii]|uniref:DUF6894 domain-containing protein n=1 Tax=Methylobacterium gnaphalii TaxID=1010610 RepID=A0A512JR88_9HYPH|nr:hypothetical protein [Methylobacterium gnaphalii]GEP12471.1 hypothetical protein MGN01_43160 [Methylobacterium gnaphalii]GJD71442.1 hypothetical protein MMMDOFMJ_4401 [Methylobacterium gnaphalii]GLS50591.1 hypothetical protein GCM10007885_34440 [Methylobacterium gnaphalii]
MPLFFFDIYNSTLQRDDVGSEFATFEEVRREAMATLPEIARWSIPLDGDTQAYTIRVRNEKGATVYTATLTFAGLRLDDPHNGAFG